MRNPYSATIEMAATPRQVFAVLTNPSLAKLWTPQIVEITPPEGGMRVGATSTARVQEFGRQFSVELVVLALEPDARIAYRMTTPMWSGRVEYVVAGKGGATDVSIVFVPDEPKRLPRIVARAMGTLARPMMAWRLRSILGSVRKVVESSQEVRSRG